MKNSAWSLGGMGVGLATLLAGLNLAAADPDPPRITGLERTTNGQQRVRWEPYPAAEAYRLLSTADLAGGFATNGTGAVEGFAWTAPLSGSAAFHRLEVAPKSSNALYMANLLNRAAYGPTPDELDRIAAMGPDAWLEEQLAPESIVETLDTEPPQTNWTHVTATGTAAPSGRLIIYFNGAANVHLDDIVLVEGTVPEQGINLVSNGGFEDPALYPPFIAHSNYADSAISTSVARTGNASLHLVGLAGGSTSANAFYQQLNIDQTGGTTYTLSFWYLPNPQLAEVTRTLTVRLSGGLDPGGVAAQVSALYGGPAVTAANLHRGLEGRRSLLADLRAWHILHAVQGRRQLQEVLLQFLENHFVTQHAKTYEYFDRYYDGAAPRDQIATYLEFRENARWRSILQDPNGTFHDLLEVSAESPAMIIYLDTVASRGDGNRIANENYARELFELFCQGVDNGYDQEDIVACSKAWTGWTVEIKDEADMDDPFAPRSTTVYDTNVINVRSNLVGVWTFHYRPEFHHNNAKTLFAGRTVPARFGPPWAGQSYELSLPARSGTTSIQDGYDILAHVADLPFTMEFISVKLCQLFIHDGFVHAEYDYTDPGRTEEAELIRRCMEAWDTPGPDGRKGNLRSVLRVILTSELFRGHGGSLQKVKTPLEFVVGAVRALHSAGPGAGGATARTDGYSLAGSGRTTATVPLRRMGEMLLFDRAEPDGYPESGAGWISAGTLAERLRFVQSFCIQAGQSGHNGGQGGLGNDAGAGTFCQPVALLKSRTDSSDWRDPAKVAWFFLEHLFPAEGRANLDLVHRAAIGFLDTAEDGVSPSPFADLSPDGGSYDTRVRGLVACLMSLPLFQQQ